MRIARVDVKTCAFGPHEKVFFPMCSHSASRDTAPGRDQPTIEYTAKILYGPGMLETRAERSQSGRLTTRFAMYPAGTIVILEVHSDGVRCVDRRRGPPAIGRLHQEK